jgi:hypothetical protein
MADHMIVLARPISADALPSQMLRANLGKLVDAANRNFKNDLVEPIASPRDGDLLAVVSSRAAGVRLMLFWEDEKLRLPLQFSLRQILHFGTVDLAENRDSSVAPPGAGVRRARRLIGRARRAGRLILSTGHSGDAALNLALSIHAQLYDAWPERDYPLVSSALAHRGDYHAVAGDLGLHSSSAFRRQRTLRLKTYLQIRELIELLVAGEK